MYAIENHSYCTATGVFLLVYFVSIVSKDFDTMDQKYMEYMEFYCLNYIKMDSEVHL